EASGRIAPWGKHARARRTGQAVLQAEARGDEGAPRVARDVPESVARLRSHTGRRMIDELPDLARALTRLIPAADRESVLGDLLEDSHDRRLHGARRAWWLSRECAAIALGMSVHRVQNWFVLPPARELAAGLLVDGRVALRGPSAGRLLGALLFCGSVGMIALGVEILVRSLLVASGF